MPVWTSRLHHFRKCSEPELDAAVSPSARSPELFNLPWIAQALIPAWCYAEGVSFIPVQSPGIPEVGLGGLVEGVSNIKAACEDHTHLKEGPKPKSQLPSN